MMLFYLNALSIVSLVPGFYIALSGAGSNTKGHSISTLLSIIVFGLVIFLTHTENWDESVGTALRLSIFSSLIVFYFVCWRYEYAQRLSILFFPYMFLISIAVAALDIAAPNVAAKSLDISGWLIIHITISLLTYALVSLAAIAALSVAFRQMALKAKKSNTISSLLPAITQSDFLQTTLLSYSAIILFAGLITGAAIEHSNSGQLLRLDHKTLFSIFALCLIALLVFIHKRFGVPGRFMSRFVLVVYLLLSMGYIGVKLITQLLL